jgi:hypothetical protein
MITLGDDFVASESYTMAAVQTSSQNAARAFVTLNPRVLDVTLARADEVG